MAEEFTSRLSAEQKRATATALASIVAVVANEGGIDDVRQIMGGGLQPDGFQGASNAAWLLVHETARLLGRSVAEATLIVAMNVEAAKAGNPAGYPVDAADQTYEDAVRFLVLLAAHGIGGKQLDVLSAFHGSPQRALTAAFEGVRTGLIVAGSTAGQSPGGVGQRLLLELDS
jgi:hypothetical protein